MQYGGDDGTGGKVLVYIGMGGQGKALGRGDIRSLTEF